MIFDRQKNKRIPKWLELAEANLFDEICLRVGDPHMNLEWRQLARWIWKKNG